MPFCGPSSQRRDQTCISCLLHWQEGSLPLVPPVCLFSTDLINFKSRSKGIDRRPLYDQKITESCRSLQTNSLIIFLKKLSIYYYYFWLHWVFIVSLRLLVGVRRLCCPEACGILVPQLGIKPSFPAFEGRFLTDGSPGKSLDHT